MQNDYLYKASVCVVTYNQEEVIQECLDSILNQKTNFRFEVIVGDDASTDQTQNILKDYERLYPNLRVIYHKKNIGPKKNVVSTYIAARGEYIFHIDGDDFALPGKLQTQVDALDQNPDCMICSHAVENVDKNSNKLNKISGSNFFGKKDYLFLVNNLPFFAHSSKAFRNISEIKCEEFYEEIEFDFEFHLKHVSYGKIIHLPQVLGCYRTLSGVATRGKRINPKMVEAKANIYEKIISTSKKDQAEQALQTYARSMLAYAHGSLIIGCTTDFKAYSRKSFKIRKISTKQFLSYILSHLPHPILNLINYLIVRIR